jgi:dTDP-4-dehydrorhamnose reductase
VVPAFTDVHFSPILTNDLAEVLLAMLRHRLCGLYHVAGSERTSKYEFAKQVAVTFGFDPGQIAASSVATAGLRARRPADVSLNTSLISNRLGYAMPNVMSGLLKFKALGKQGFPQQLRNYSTEARTWT